MSHLVASYCAQAWLSSEVASGATTYCPALFLSNSVTVEQLWDEGEPLVKSLIGCTSEPFKTGAVVMILQVMEAGPVAVGGVQVHCAGG